MGVAPGEISLGEPPTSLALGIEARRAETRPALGVRFTKARSRRETPKLPNTYLLLLG